MSNPFAQQYLKLADLGDPDIDDIRYPLLLLALQGQSSLSLVLFRTALPLEQGLLIHELSSSFLLLCSSCCSAASFSLNGSLPLYLPGSLVLLSLIVGMRGMKRRESIVVVESTTTATATEGVK